MKSSPSYARRFFMPACMNKKHILLYGLINALGVFVYTSGVAYVMFHLGNLFPAMPGMMGLALMLMLFVVSATVVGALVLGKPILWYFENKKREALQLFLTTLAWLFAMVTILFAILMTIYAARV